MPSGCERPEVAVAAGHLRQRTLPLVVKKSSYRLHVSGETALITAAIAASQGQLNIVAVIAVAGSAAVLGDNIGYLLGRLGGWRILTAPGPLAAQRRRVLAMGEPCFARHGPGVRGWRRRSSVAPPG